MGRGRLPEGALSGSVVSGQKPLPSWREQPMAHLRLGAGASWVEIAVRPHVCLGPLCCLFSSLTHPLFSGLGMFHAVPGAQGGDSKEEGVPAWIIDHTYCVLAPQCLLFTLYPPHSQNPAGIFPSHPIIQPGVGVGAQLGSRNLRISTWGGRGGRQEGSRCTRPCLPGLHGKCMVLGRVLACLGRLGCW